MKPDEVEPNEGEESVDDKSFDKAALAEIRVEQVPMDRILYDSSLNCRGPMTWGEVTELAKSIKQHGLLQAIILKPLVGTPGKDYRIVAGHRRFQAVLQHLNWKTIPARIVDVSDHEARAINLLENLDRKDLNLLQEARAIEAFKDAGTPVNKTASAINRSYRWVQLRFDLLSLDHEAQQMAAAGLINYQEIRKLARMKNRAEQKLYIDAVKDAIKGAGQEVKEKSPWDRDHTITRFRNQRQVDVMADHVQESLGSVFAVHALTWASGRMSDVAFLRELRAESLKVGRPYELPLELRGKLELDEE